MEETIAWIVIFIVLLAIEAATLGLTTIWFAGGALLAFLAALAGAGTGVQIFLFLVVSVVLLIFTRPFAVRYINNDRIKTNVESIAGQIGMVTKKIDNRKEEGQVLINGLEWSARSRDHGKVIEEGREVTVLEVKGVKLIVEETMEVE